ncbi:MAG: B12-binding domain-containing radical SAM protein [Euryarchaeota archaeon]|nr:B12-binding domain-containing radical SAM protein [Euryarchaeota archaeon]
MNSGYKIVLTADRTLMSTYRGGIFLGFSACFPRGHIPDWLYYWIFCPSVPEKDGKPLLAPYSLRKIEAALLDYGFKEEELVVTHPERLHEAVGSDTKVVGISEMDPLGIGPASSTFTNIFGGETQMAFKFKELLNHPAIRRFRPKIIVGGPGAWQLESESIRKQLGIDTVVIGEGEKVVGPLFKKAIGNEPLPGLVYGDVAEVDEIPVIRNPAVDGFIEISRGCGRDCRFCSPTLLKFRSLPRERILREVKVNVEKGKSCKILLHSEDILRYQARGLKANSEAVLDLFSSILNFPGVTDISVSHIALASVCSNFKLLVQLSELMNLGSKDRLWIGVQTGVETGSPALIEKYMPGKVLPFNVEDWPKVVEEAFALLHDNHWVPAATLILGLPGETSNDVIKTVELIESLKPYKSLIVPLLFVPIDTSRLNGASSFTKEAMLPEHVELLKVCFKHDLYWVDCLLKEYTKMNQINIAARAGLKFVAHGIRFGLRGYLRESPEKIIERIYNKNRQKQRGLSNRINLLRQHFSNRINMLWRR